MTMQSYAIPNTYSTPNLMDEVRGFFSKWSEGNRKNLASLAYRRDPDSLLDELLIGIWVLLIVATGFTVIFGAVYHYTVFTSATGWGVAGVVGSFLVFMVLEICKVFFGLHLARAFFSMLWYRSIYRFLFMAGIATIVVFAFQWSISISTKGVQQVNSFLKSGQIYQAQEFTPPAAVADIDRQLVAIETAKAAGGKATWRGRTTKEGLEVIQSNTDLQKNLLAQRAMILEAAKARHDSLTTTLLQEVNLTSATLSNYGGKSEYAVMLLIVLVVLFEFINYDRNKAKQPETVPATQPETPLTLETYRRELAALRAELEETRKKAQPRL